MHYAFVLLCYFFHKRTIDCTKCYSPVCFVYAFNRHITDALNAISSK